MRGGGPVLTRRAVMAGGGALATAALATICSLSANFANAIGSGGILNLVPQATVEDTSSEGQRLLKNYRVYVHPTEGSIVLILEGSETALGMDKNKKHAKKSNAIQAFPQVSFAW